MIDEDPLLHSNSDFKNIATEWYTPSTEVKEFHGEYTSPDTMDDPVEFEVGEDLDDVHAR